MVNLTGWHEDKDQSCIVDKGEHPCVTKRSCVFYQASTGILETVSKNRRRKRGRPRVLAPEDE